MFDEGFGEKPRSSEVAAATTSGTRSWVDGNAGIFTGRESNVVRGSQGGRGGD